MKKPMTFKEAPSGTGIRLKQLIARNALSLTDNLGIDIEETRQIIQELLELREWEIYLDEWKEEKRDQNN